MEQGLPPAAKDDRGYISGRRPFEVGGVAHHLAGMGQVRGRLTVHCLADMD